MLSSLPRQTFFGSCRKWSPYFAPQERYKPSVQRIAAREHSPLYQPEGGKTSRGWIGRAKGYDPAVGRAKEREDDKQDEDARKAAGHGAAIDAPKKPYFCTHKDVS